MKKKSAVFLIHPRDHRDLVERFWWVKYIPPFITDPVMARLSGRLGYSICEKINVYNKANVYLLALALKGHQIASNNLKDLKMVRERILEAVYFSQDYLNAEVIGLGALTASVTNGGSWLISRNKIKSNITHGDTYATFISVEGIKKIIALSRVLNPTIAIVGAYGIIGTALCKILSNDYELLIMGRNKMKLECLHKTIGGKGIITTDMKAIKRADIVVTATSHPEALIESEHLKNGAIIYDIAQPANISKKLLKERPDILRIDGALVKIPRINITFDMRTGKGHTFACLAETILMTLEDIKGHHVGQIDLNYCSLAKILM